MRAILIMLSACFLVMDAAALSPDHPNIVWESIKVTGSNRQDAANKVIAQCRKFCDAQKELTGNRCRYPGVLVNPDGEETRPRLSNVTLSSDPFSALADCYCWCKKPDLALEYPEGMDPYEE